MIPKNKQIIIITEKGRRVAIWSEADKHFVYANPCTDLYNGKWNMNYFENESIEEDEILAWKEL